MLPEQYRYLLFLPLLYCTIISRSNASIIFGFETAKQDKSIYSPSADLITITLYWSYTLKYQCHVEPTEYNTFYFCDSSHATTTTFECDTTSPISNPIEYGLQIDNNGYDALEIDRVIINDSHHENAYIVDFFCFNSSYLNNITYYLDFIALNHCLDALYDGYDILPIDYDDGYEYQLIILDDNIISNGSNGSDESYVIGINSAAQCPPIGCIGTDSIIETKEYGNTYYPDGDILINQGIIKGISSWSIQIKLDAVANFIFINQTGATSKEYGGSSTVITCDPFLLNDTDYINGYSIIYGDFINGLTFYTNNGESYTCYHNLSNSSDSYIVSDTIIYNNYYLSGFFIDYGSVIVAISFQFTSFNMTRFNCSVLDKYILIKQQMTWYDAKSYCVDKLNSSLATVITDNDLQIIKEIRTNLNDTYQHKDIWIGLSDFFHGEGIWRWDDETTCHYTQSGSCVDDKHWAKGEPNGIVDGEDCAEISYGHNDKFNDDECKEENIFLCNNGPYIYYQPTSAPITASTTTQTTELSTELSTASQTAPSNEPTVQVTGNENGDESTFIYAIIGLFSAFLIMVILILSISYCYHKKKTRSKLTVNQVYNENVAQIKMANISVADQDITEEAGPGSPKFDSNDALKDNNMDNMDHEFIINEDNESVEGNANETGGNATNTNNIEGNDDIIISDDEFIIVETKGNDTNKDDKLIM